MEDWVKNPERRALAKKFLDKVANDPQFRERLLDDPQGALHSSGLAQEFREFQASTSDVSGYSMDMLSNTFFGDVLLDGMPEPEPVKDPYEYEPGKKPPYADPGALPGPKTDPPVGTAPTPDIA